MTLFACAVCGKTEEISGAMQMPMYWINLHYDLNFGIDYPESISRALDEFRGDHLCCSIGCMEQFHDSIQVKTRKEVALWVAQRKEARARGEDMGIPGGEIGLDENKRYYEVWGGGYDELPAGMSVYEYEGLVDRQIKEAQYERLTRSDAVVHGYALAHDQGAHPEKNTAAMQYDHEHIPQMRRIR